MEFKRLEIMFNEVEVITAIMENTANSSFKNLFVHQEDLPLNIKMDKICEIVYKVFQSRQITEEQVLLDMFEDFFEDSEVGPFCIEFIKMNLEFDRENVAERLNKLLEMNCDAVPESQIKVDYLQMTLSLLLNQFPLDMVRINEYSEKLKEILNNEKARQAKLLDLEESNEE